MTDTGADILFSVETPNNKVDTYCMQICVKIKIVMHIKQLIIHIDYICVATWKRGPYVKKGKLSLA